MAPSRSAFERAIARISELGWFAKVHGSGDELAALGAWLRPLKLPAVIDHMGGPDWRRGLDSPGYRLIFDLLRNGNWWIQISNGDRRSAGEHPWEDMVPIARALVDAAPDRAIWATDWPHVTYQKKTVPNDAELLELFYRCVPDEAARQRVLVANPERLLGFDA
jgi:2-pyrone-4,6-dicarboxylate lactonase